MSPPRVGVPAYAGVPLSGDVRFVDAATASERCWSEVGASDATLVVSTTLQTVAAAAAELVAAGRKPGHRRRPSPSPGTTTRQRTWTATLATHRRRAEGHQGAADPRGADRRDSRRRRARPRSGSSCRGSRPSRCSAGGCWCRAPRSRPRRCPTSCAPTAPCRTRCRPSRSSRRAPRSRWSGRSRAWSPAATSGSPSPRSTRSRRCGRSSRSTGSTPARSPASRSPRSASRPPQSLVEFGVKPDLVPSGEQSAAGLLEDWPPYDPVFDPIDRVFLPRADIATETLVAGLVELGWEVDDVTAYRTVRASPPPADTREAIKGGGFDAVLFTSSSTVRNLVGIAGKPHNVDGDRLHRPGDRQDGRGARAAGRRAGPRAVGPRAGRGAGRLRRGAAAARAARGRRAGRAAERAAAGSRRKARA